MKRKFTIMANSEVYGEVDSEEQARAIIEMKRNLRQGGGGKPAAAAQLTWILINNKTGQRTSFEPKPARQGAPES